MLRQEGLEPDAAARLDRLGQTPPELEGPLRRAEVRQVERRVGEHEGSDGDRRLLRQTERHGRAHEDPRRARLKRRPRRLGVGRGDRRVVSHDLRLGERPPGLRLEPLRAPADELEPAAAAAPAEARGRHPAPAEPAREGPRLPVVEERQAAATAAPHGPAVRAGQAPGEAEPVEDEEHGPPAGERRARGVEETGREARRRGFLGARAPRARRPATRLSRRDPMRASRGGRPPSSRGSARGSQGGSFRPRAVRARGRDRGHASAAHRGTCARDPPRRRRPPGRAAPAGATPPSASRPPAEPPPDGRPTTRPSARGAGPRS